MLCGCATTTREAGAPVDTVATNKPFEVRGATVVDFRDGRISRNSDYWDLTTYLRQVGLAR
jgi:ketosteroid isomerase-like protein